MHLVFQWLAYGTDSGETSSRLVDETIGAVTEDAALHRAMCMCVCDKVRGVLQWIGILNQKGYEILLGNNVLISDKDDYPVAHCGLSSTILESRFYLYEFRYCVL